MQDTAGQKSYFAWAGPYAHILLMVVAGLALLSLSRLGLVIWLSDRVLATHQLVDIFLQGVRADVILVCLFAALPVALALPLAQKRWQHLWFRFTYIWCVAALVLITFMEVSTPAFIAQYDIRPNRLFIEYLQYPKEVFSTLWQGFKIPLLFGLVLTVAAIVLFGRWLRLPEATLSVGPFWARLLAWPLAVFIVFAGIRSTTDHRPANPALFAITSDAMVNSLVINSGYSVLYALYSLKHEARSTEIYGVLDADQMLTDIRQWPWLAGNHYLSSELPTLHHQAATSVRPKPLNIVIILQESLGATFVESLGGIPVTPELESLKDEGIWFENLYATGTRSVRGIEAVVSGFMPTPAQSVVKLSGSQRDFTTIASIVKKAGYTTSFIYGGEAHFDNMRSFFTGNGFDHIIDAADIKNPVFTGSWGASDEDLFNKTHETLLNYQTSGKPFLTLVFTSTNHEPFEFPQDRITLYEEPAATAANAVKYADWAMGEFFKKAKASPYWKDTLFLVVADHDIRVYGNELVPVSRFKIPGLIVGADIKPERITPIASQIDLAPTLLSLAGVSSCHPMTGRDFTKDAVSPGRALIQFNDLFALVDDNQATILKPNAPALSAAFDKTSGKLTLDDSAASPSQARRALAHAQLPSYLYREARYRDMATCAGTHHLATTETAEVTHR